MPEIDTAVDEDSRASRMLATLEEEEAAQEGAAEQTPETPAEADESAPETASAEVPEEKAEPEVPAIEPPSTWKSELKERWKAIPVDLQRDLAQWETERNSGVNQRLEEASRIRREAEEARKASADNDAAVIQAQQRYAQQLSAFAQTFEQFDPILTEYRNTDLVKLARENPARYAELEASVRQRQQVLSLAQQEQQNAQAQALQAHFAREEQRLLDAFPEWKANPTAASKGLDELRSHVVSAYGFRPEEVRTIADHRYVRLANDALAYHRLKAQVDADKAKQTVTAAQLAAKRTAPNPKVVATPEPAGEVGRKTGADRDKALINRASKARNLHDKAAILANLMDER